MKIRRAKIEDVGRIAEIHVQSWQVAYRDIMLAELLNSLDLMKREEMWRSRLEKNRKVFVVESVESEVIGFLSIGAPRDEDTPDSAELKAIYLDPRFYGTGVGTVFWQVIEKSLSADCVYLWVLATNARGIAFYERNGFRSDGRKKSFNFGEQAFEEIRYRKDLP